MAKKQNSKPVQPVTAPQKQAAAPSVLESAVPNPNSGLTLHNFYVQAAFIGVLAFIFYFNTFRNEWAHDDGIVIVKNEYVQEGFAGIPDILSKDAYDSYYRQLNTVNQLNGGRYRPLSIVTFAIEQQFMGAIPEKKVDSVLKENISYGVKGEQQKKLISQMHVRHVLNVLWYIGSLVALLYFLRFIVFKNDPLIAFIATLIFAIHPIHTEVVANVKSRDEIMSLLFICLTFIFDFKFRDEKKPQWIVAALICYFLAFLSKEYAITFVVLLPMAMYIFRKATLQQCFLGVVPYFAVIVAYLFIRFSVVGRAGDNSDAEVLNNPYLFASGMEKIATEIATSLNYLKLLIFPHPLSADYSYDSIPYKDFGNWLVWLSLAIHTALVVAMVYLFSKRHVLSFAIAFYLLHLMLVCNIFFDIGATMGERLIYHSSVGFAIAIAWLLYKGAMKIKPGQLSMPVLAGFMIIVIVLSGYKTITRNAEWKNDNTLFAADIKVVPNSVLVCANVAASLITLADDQKDEKTRSEMLHRSIELLDHALEIHPTMVASFMNRGIAWYKLGQMDKAKANLDSVKRHYPNYPTLPGIYKLISDDYMKKGWDRYGSKKMYPEAIAEFMKGINIDSANADLWYNLGGAYYSNRQLPEAIEAWKITLRLQPDYKKAQMGMQAAMAAMNQGNVQQQAPAKPR